MILNILIIFVPWDRNSYEQEFVKDSLLVFILFASGSGKEIFACTIVSCFGLITFEPLIYNLDITVGFVFNNLALTIGIFAVTNLFCMLLIYVARIKGKLVELLCENLKLLDRMHEGLIVISEKDLCL